MTMIHTMLAWHPILEMCLGINTDRQYFIIGQESGMYFMFDGYKKQTLKMQLAFQALIGSAIAKNTFEPFDWLTPLDVSSSALLFDRKNQRISFEEAIPALSMLMGDNSYHPSVETFIYNEADAVEQINSWYGRKTQTDRWIAKGTMNPLMG